MHNLLNFLSAFFPLLNVFEQFGIFIIDAFELYILLSPTGLKFYDHMSIDKAKEKAKPVKTHTCRISTLMKPTTSQLAKQNRPAQVANSR